MPQPTRAFVDPKGQPWLELDNGHRIKLPKASGSGNPIPGPIGPQGPPGQDGLDGGPGPTGPTGPMGLRGATGPAGPTGSPGPQGPIGPVGPTGLQGIQGTPGEVGVIRGYFGQVTTPADLPQDGFIPADFDGPGRPPAGYQISEGEYLLYQPAAGPTHPDYADLYGFFPDYGDWRNIGKLAGPEGPAGAQGNPGAAGPTGPKGATGPASTVPGPTGPAGAPGAAGGPGPTGPQGPAGAAGPTGPKGNTGAQGPAGPAGPSGLKFGRVGVGSVPAGDTVGKTIAHGLGRVPTIAMGTIFNDTGAVSGVCSVETMNATNVYFRIRNINASAAEAMDLSWLVG